jgi:hypothetical protein
MAKTLPPLGPDDCPLRSDSHLCRRPGTHCDDHECECGHRWPALPGVRVLRLQPDDVLLLAFDQPTTPAVAVQARDQFNDWFPDHRTVVISQAELLVVRPEQADQIEEGAPS